MQLIVQRSQQIVKGMLGGDKGTQFNLSCRLHLTTEEQEMVNRYWPADTFLGGQDESITLGVKFGTRKPGLRLGDVTQGVSYQAKSVGMVQEAEQELASVCRQFKGYLLAAASYSGESAIEL